MFFFLSTGVEDRMSVIWEKGVVSWMMLFNFAFSGLIEINVLCIFCINMYMCTCVITLENLVFAFF